ncbi:hypothetical protein HK405_014480, partial [Cladochytrium tenue]
MSRDRIWRNTVKQLQNPEAYDGDDDESFGLLKILRGLSRRSNKQAGETSTEFSWSSSSESSVNVDSLERSESLSADWHSSLDKDYICSRGNQREPSLEQSTLYKLIASISEEIKTGVKPSKEHLLAVLGPPVDSGNVQSFAGVEPDIVWSLYETLSDRYPETLAYLKRVHWTRIARAAIIAAIPTKWDWKVENGHSKDPHFVKVLPRRSLRLLCDMKRSGMHPDSEIYSALYKGFQSDPKQAMDVHRFIIKSSHGLMPASGGVKVVSDESIRRLLGVLLYGGHPSYFRRPKVFDSETGQHVSFLIQPHSQQLGLLVDSETNGRKSVFDAASAAEELWDDMKALKIQPSVDTLLAFLEAFSVWNDRALVAKVHARLERHVGSNKDLNVYEGLIMAYFRLRGFKTVLKIADEVVQKHMRPN